MGVIKKFKLFLGILIPIFAFFLMSHNTFALTGKIDLTTAYNDYIFLYVNNGQAYHWDTNRFGDRITTAMNSINGFTWTTNISGPSYGNFTNGYYEFTLDGQGNGEPGWAVNISDLSNVTCEVWSTTTQQITSNAYILKPYYFAQNGRWAVDYRCDFQASNGLKPSYIFFRVGNATSSRDVTPIMSPYNSEGNLDNIISVDPRIRNVSFTYNTSDESSADAQLGDLINGQKNMYDQDKEFYDRNYEAVDNIENQNSSDIQGAENQQTTNLINVITGFISAFSGITAGNCNLTLEFPSYAGGTRVVNICSGKEKAPRIVEIGSSLLLICVFVPLAFVLIRMIYNEIRSWTNG